MLDFTGHYMNPLLLNRLLQAGLDLSAVCFPPMMLAAGTIRLARTLPDIAIAVPTIGTILHCMATKNYHDGGWVCAMFAYQPSMNIIQNSLQFGLLMGAATLATAATGPVSMLAIAVSYCICKEVLALSTYAVDLGIKMGLTGTIESDSFMRSLKC